MLQCFKTECFKTALLPFQEMKGNL